jgi:hypothetical protein
VHWFSVGPIMRFPVNSSFMGKRPLCLKITKWLAYKSIQAIKKPSRLNLAQPIKNQFSKSP